MRNEAPRASAWHLRLRNFSPACAGSEIPHRRPLFFHGQTRGLLVRDKKLVFFFLIIFFGILFLPLIGLAGTSTYEVTIGGVTSTVTYEGLVPCGKEVSVGGATTTIACQFCHFFVMFDAILDFIFLKIVFPIAILMIVIAGIMYVGAVLEIIPGGFKTLTQAKDILGSVFIGLLIIFSAWLIINFFFTIIGVANWTGLNGGWWRINCEIKI